ncbi:hypothetical protein BESB_061910 [Besnoitia besnoiti]|uniref:DUF3752 domain-containing protein n=1 Tax=Besnoitia besnoiti TaxID=94643 RepID=A0A2A9MDM9_BESBE|nr:hypothetical protein BESB_061910 [Besnoitia besnoiti]PFH35304.1 hypothetical protein BESB_061910 [Besnoitia besnoiti]
MRERESEELSNSESSEQKRRKRDSSDETESSDSSSDSSSDEDKRKKKRKQGKKSKKKEKKEKKKKKQKKGKKKKAKKEKEKAEELYDEFEVRRLLTNLLTKSRSLDTELESLFSNLDEKQTVFLDGLPDATLRKKLRHLFRALNLTGVKEEASVGFKKGKALSSLSLRRLVRSLCREIKAELPPPTGLPPAAETPPQQLTEEELRRLRRGDSPVIVDAAELAGAAAPVGPAPPPGREGGQDKGKREACRQRDAERSAEDAIETRKRGREEWMLEAPAYLKKAFTANSRMEKMLEQKRREDAEAEQMRAAMEEWNRKHRARSLREMTASGEIKDAQETYKKWKQAMWAQNLWGKSAAEQRAIEEGKGEENAGQPWRRFDRERDLDTRQTTREDYNKLVAKASELNNRFHSTWQSSFL